MGRAVEGGEVAVVEGPIVLKSIGGEDPLDVTPPHSCYTKKARFVNGAGGGSAQERRLITGSRL